MRNALNLLLLGWLVCMTVCLPAMAQDDQDEIPDSIDMQYVESIDPYSVSVGEYLAFPYEELSIQARKAYRAGDYEQAAQFFLALIRRNVDDAGVIYDLACCFGQLQMPVQAALFLEGAFAAGYEDYDWASWDPDFEPVREDPAFKESWERIGELMAERSAGLGELVVVEAPVYLRCRVQLPENYDPEMEYPLLIGLHGYGDNMDNFATLLERREIDTAGFIYAAPQAPYPFMPASSIGYSWIEGNGEDEEAWLTARAMSEQYIADVVAKLKGQYRISAVYLMGFSQGCFMTYNAGLTYPELFSGLICFAGWLDSEHFTVDQLDAARNLRVFIVQGTEDKLVEPQEAYNARDELVEHGFTVELYEFDGGHAVPEDALRAALIYIGLLE